jgi:hypothetical protein
MFCKECGNALPDDAKFCMKCGKPTGGIVVQGTTGPLSSEQDAQFHEAVKMGLEIATRGAKGIYLYKKNPPNKDKYLVEADSSYASALGVLKQLDDNPKLKGKTPQQRFEAIANDLEYQRFFAAVYQGLGALEYFHKNNVKCIENFQVAINGGLPPNSVFVNETKKIQDGYMANIRAEDFESWVKIKRDILKEPINVNELGFFEKRKYKP